MTSSRTQHFDVIIIGAGAAGLAAAQKLKAAKKKILILEARDRIGGRAHTVSAKNADFHIEMGPEFVHGEPQITFDLLQKHGLTSYEVNDRHLFLKGKKLQEAPEFWDSVEEVLHAIPHTRNDLSMEQALQTLKKIPAEKIQLTRTFIQGFDATLINQVSANEIKEAIEQVSDPKERKMRRLLTGYSSLLGTFAKELKLQIRLKQTVKHVKWEAGKVLVETENSTYSAKKLLITVPVGVLKSKISSESHIRFTPALTEKAEALKFLEMGPVVKVLLQFKADFWSEKFSEMPSFFHAPGFRFLTWWTSNPVYWPLVTAWSGGDPALELAKLSEKEVVKIAVTEFAKLMKVPAAKVKSNLVKAHFHNWVQDDFSLGAYSFVKACGKNVREKLARTVANTLFFAGEATSVERNGTVDGAMLSGQAAAIKILK